jgi:hypothetical protein
VRVSGEEEVGTVIAALGKMGFDAKVVGSAG